MQTAILPLFFLFSLKRIVIAIDLLNLDYDLGMALGIGEFAGGIILGMLITLFVCCLPIYKKNMTATTVLSFFSISLCVAIGWLNIFFLILPIFLIALGITDKATGIVSGHSKDK